MLPSNEALKSGNLFKSARGFIGLWNVIETLQENTYANEATPQHLYVLSEGKIKKGDYCYHDESRNIVVCVSDLMGSWHHLSKVIATTDESCGLPTIPEGFLKEYCKGEIDSDMVLYSSIRNNEVLTNLECKIIQMKKNSINNMGQCMLSILDSLKLVDGGDTFQPENESLSGIMFRKMKAYNVDLNKILDFTHLKPTDVKNVVRVQHDNVTANNNGGFFDLPNTKQKCTHIEHNPPAFIHIPQGKGYRHICPKCGKTTDLIPPQIGY